MNLPRTRYDIQKKQPNSRMCFVCGLSNSAGLKASFFELENDCIVSLFDGEVQLQGYPGRLHGGMAAMILDETIGRAICIEHGEAVWGVTLGLETRFRQPVPVDSQITTVASIVKQGPAAVRRCRSNHSFRRQRGCRSDWKILAVTNRRYRRLRS